jgi:16S rRNA (uracil1498-N3)-methyltransferase
MRIPRLHCPAAAAAAPGTIVTLDARESRHLATVLRARSGDVVRLLPGDGTEWNARLVEADPGACVVRIEERREESDSPSLSPYPATTVIALALARGGAFETALEHLVELGVDEVIALECERCTLRIAPADAPRKHDRWQRIAEAAAKQSGRRTLPRIVGPMPWEQWVREENAHPGAGVWMAHPADDAPTLFDEVAAWAARREEHRTADSTDPKESLPRAVVAIGPEGGFSPGELRLGRESGVGMARLPGHVLRVATAAAAALVTIHLALGASDF